MLLDSLQDVDGEVDIEALMEKTVPCELGQNAKSAGHDLPFCTEVAEWVLVIRCNVCGNAKQALLCSPCRNFVKYFVRAVQTLLFGSKTKCTHRVYKKKATWVKI